MNCRDAHFEFDAALEGKESPSVRRHLQECFGCMEAFRRLSVFHHAVTGIPAPAPPRDLRERIAREIDFLTV